jgi:hypothetical protein
VLHSDGQFLEHEWRLSSGADPARIKLDLPPGTSAETRADGALEIHSHDTTILWRKPAASQKTGAATIQIDAAYRVDSHTVSLRLGNYRRDLPLTIDPVIDFPTSSTATATTAPGRSASTPPATSTSPGRQ